MPTAIEGVPSEVLEPRNAWADKEAYDKKANELANLSVKTSRNSVQFQKISCLKADH